MRKEDALQKLQRQRDLIDDLKLKPRGSQDFKKWRRDTEILIEKIFGSDTRQIEDFKKIDYIMPILVFMLPNKGCIKILFQD